MEFVRMGEGVLRSQQQPLLSFLVPQTRRVQGISRTQTCRAVQCQNQTRRAFTTTPRRRQDDQSGKPQTGPSIDSEMSALFDSTLDMNKGTPVAPTSRTSKFKSPPAQKENPPSRAAARSSADDIFESLLGSSSTAAARSPNARNTTNDASRDRSESLFGELSQMLDPQNNTRQPARKNNSAGGPPALPEPPALKLNASLGRTISVDSSRGMDVGRAFRALDMAVNRNQVKRHERLQKFHERPGMKRKRLKSERWRRRFKEGFRAIVKRVQGMKAQGW